TRHGCRWVLVDPWNEVEHLWGRQDTEATYLNRALRELKRLGRRFQIALIIVAHPTKEGGKAEKLREASLYDINGGGCGEKQKRIRRVRWGGRGLTTASLGEVREVKVLLPVRSFRGLAKAVRRLEVDFHRRSH